MRGLTSVMSWFVVGTWAVLACGQMVGAAQKDLQGIWTATNAEREGKTAEDVVGQGLGMTSSRSSARSPEELATLGQEAEKLHARRSSAEASR